ncbi:MAG TPA: class I SAM-dependent RNA methyltransferase [Casimicrobiaceae bacterium]
MTERYFAPCPRGLEAALAAELGQLGAAEVAGTDGGVAFAGDLALACRANLESRLASRILWRVGGGAYRDERDLYALVHALDWHRLFKAERTLRVDVTATRAPLKSLEFATLRVKDAVCDRFRAERAGVRPSIDKRTPDVRVNAYLTDREATVYLDTSGEPLFKRGYRRDADEAPLRENLAAGLLALAGWTPDTPLLDPLCGSGTIAVEAALIAADRAPGLTRTFGFQKLDWFDGPAWQRMKQTARDRIRPAPSAPAIFASDVAQAAVAKCAGNLAAAQLTDFVALDRADVLERDAPASTGILVANPPYGERMDDAERLAAFYPQLGDALKRRFAGWTAYFLTADLRLAKLIGLKATRRTPLYNGPLECRLFAVPLVAGSMREDAKAG